MVGLLGGHTADRTTIIAKWQDYWVALRQTGLLNGKITKMPEQLLCNTGR